MELLRALISSAPNFVERRSTDDGHPALIMEWVDGQLYSDWLARQPDLPDGEAVDLLALA